MVNGFKNERVYLNDPAKGTYSISFEEFDEKFTGICMLFSPGKGFIPDGKPRSTFDFALKRLKGCGIAIAFVVVTTVISSLIGVINPVFSRIFLDRLLTKKDPGWYLPFITIMSVFAFVQIVSGLIKTLYSKRIEGKMAIHGNSSYMWKVLNLPMEFFSQRYAGDILARRAGNANLSNNLINTFAPLFLNAFMMIFYLFVMLKNSVILTMVGVFSIVINMFISRLISKRRVNLSRVQMRDAGKLNSCTTSGIEMIETIKASGAEEGYFRRWSGFQASVNTQKVRFLKLNQYLGSIPGMVSIVTGAVVQLLGIYLIIRGKFTIGMVTAFQGFLASFTAPASTFISAGQTIQELRTDMERIEDVMEYPADVNSPVIRGDREETYKKLTGELKIKNLTFGYSRLAEPLIKDFCLDLRP